MPKQPTDVSQNTTYEAYAVAIVLLFTLYLLIWLTQTNTVMVRLIAKQHYTGCK